METLFRQSNLFELWIETCAEGLDIAPALRFPALVTLLKFADGQVHNNPKPPVIEPRRVISTFIMLVRADITQLFEATHCFNNSEKKDIATCVQLHLGMLEILLDTEKTHDLLDGDSPALAEALVRKDRLNIELI
jgi:hypothetical protein